MVLHFKRIHQIRLQLFTGLYQKSILLIYTFVCLCNCNSFIHRYTKR